MKNIRWIAVLAAFVLVLAACGDDDDGGDTTTTAAAGGDGGTETTAAAGDDDGATTTAAPLDEPVTLRVLIHSQEPMTTFVQDFSREFEAANPGVTVDVAVVGAGDLEQEVVMLQRAGEGELILDGWIAEDAQLTFSTEDRHV